MTEDMELVHEVLIKAVELELPSSQLAMEALTRLNTELLELKEALDAHEGKIAH